jgi:hypothetical protein
VPTPLLTTLLTLAILIFSTVLVISASLWLKHVAQMQQTQRKLPSSRPAPATHPQPVVPAPPTSEAVPPASPNPGFVLTGIVEGRGEPYAIINGAIVRVGEQVQDTTLREIAHSSVTLQHPDGTLTTLRTAR